MQAKIDYVSFSAPCRMVFEIDDLDNQKNAEIVLNTFLSGIWEPIVAGHCWEVYKAKGFYHTRIFDTHSKISVFFGCINTHVYCEVGGQALDHIRAIGLYEKFLQKIAARASRIDFAVDMETETSVMEFIDNHQIRTFKAGGHIFSEDGETAYVGSWKGERFARVYRYHKPHPRCKLLRAEVVLRGDYAKQAMNLVLSEGEVMASFIAHEAFKWSHPVWQPDQISQSRIKSQRSDKEQTGTIRWLRGDVVTAILSAHNNGLFDAVRWFEEDVRPRLPKG